MLLPYSYTDIYIFFARYRRICTTRINLQLHYSNNITLYHTLLFVTIEQAII